MAVHALITARCGSKRIPKKNIREFLDQGPIITVPIRALISCSFISRVYVDTDCDEIAEIARDAGASVPDLRPPELADDFATTLEVVRSSVERRGLRKGDILLVVYPTSTLDPTHYTEAWKRFRSTKPKMLVSVCSAGIPASRFFSLEKGTMRIKESNLSSMNTRTQDEPIAFKDAGKFYLGSVNTWVNTENIFDQAEGFILPPQFGIDIDTEEDWKFAEYVHKGIAASTA